MISARVYKEPFDAREFRDQQDRWNAEQFRYLRFRIQLLADVKGLDVTKHQDLYLGDFDFNDIEELIRPEEREMNSVHYLEFGWRGRFAEAIIAQGERDVQLAPKRCARGSYYNVQEGLDTLFNAGRVISLAHSPAAYKRIAQHYLELYAILEKCDDEDGITQIQRDPRYRIQARSYQQFLNNYDEIVFGR